MVGPTSVLSPGKQSNRRILAPAFAFAGILMAVFVAAWPARAAGEPAVQPGTGTDLRSDRIPGILFGGSAGPAIAWIDQTALEEDDELLAGASWDLYVGWRLVPQWAFGGQFATWGSSFLLEPVHLHTIGARVDWEPTGAGGAFVGALAGLALTEGDAGARAGGAAALHGGYRWLLGDWAGLGPFVRVHGHLYSGGAAGFAVLGAELQFSGVWRD